MGVCLAEDDYTRSRYYTHPRWVALLSDGTTALADDDRPGEAEASAWQRLRAHCLGRGVWVVGLSLQFRSHVERPVPDGARGYFLRTNLIGWLADNVTRGYYLVGHLTDAGVAVQRWCVPELLPGDTEVRDPADERLVGPSLIPSGPLL
jgi:hypothetical protein